MSWEPINLAELDPRPATLPTVGGVGLVYPGKRHVFSGPPESAKTLAAYAITLEEIRRGENVLLIDFEMGPWDARDRLREMGATDDELARLLYVEPELPASEAVVEDLVTSWTFSLAVIDAAAGAYSLQGLDDNLRRDVETFARLYVQAFWQHGVASIVLDHVGKNAKQRGAFAIGSERKVGGADVHLGFEAVLPLTRGGRGLYKITTHKDRLGHLARPKAAELELRSDPDTNAIEWTFRAPEPGDEQARWQPTRLMEKVSCWLEEQSDAVARGAVESNVRGAAEFVRRALDELIREGYVVETAGARRARLVRSVIPYRESTSSTSSSSSDRSDEVVDDEVISTSSDDADEVKPASLSLFDGADATSSDLVGTSSRRSDDPPSATSSASSALYRADADEVGDEVGDDEVERLAELARQSRDEQAPARLEDEEGWF